jgi:hypothetical protein
MWGALSDSQVKVTLRLTVSQSVSLDIEPHLLLFDSYGLVFWGALSDERTDLSLVYAASPRQHSPSRARVPWDSWPYFTVLDLRLSLSSSPMTRWATVEVFDPASTRDSVSQLRIDYLCSLGADRIENTASTVSPLLHALLRDGCGIACLHSRCLPVTVFLAVLF